MKVDDRPAPFSDVEDISKAMREKLRRSKTRPMRPPSRLRKMEADLTAKYRRENLKPHLISADGER